MNQGWILQKRETRRTFSKSTWVPLRASINSESGDVKSVGFTSEYFGCGSVASRRSIAKLLKSAAGVISGSVLPLSLMLTKTDIPLLLNSTSTTIDVKVVVV